jgi:HAMP domain-containing protein
LRRVPIRMKLAGALILPLFALIIVTVLEVVQSSRHVERVRDQAALAEASIGPASLLSNLEDERNAAGVYLLAVEGAISLPVENNAEARGLVNDSLATLRSEVEAQGGAVEEAYAPALERLSELDTLRAEVDATPDAQRTLLNIEPVARIFDEYTTLMDGFFDANKRAALAVDDPGLRRGAELVDLQARQANLIAILVKDLLLAQVGGDADGVNTNAEIAMISGHLGELRHNEQLIAVKATGPYREHAEALFAADETQRFPELVDQSIESGEVDVDAVLANSAGEDPTTFGYTIFRTAVTDTLVERADELESAAIARQRWFAMLALVALVVAAVVSWIVSRSITRPLRSLTRQARDMAERRLPEAVIDILETPLGDDVQVPSIEAVAVRTRDEVSDVASALNTVQDTALDLAVEQAVLRRNIADSFVNLGRRNQNLLGRQLDFITELETNETDPDALANLFRLDHLATRMRRNAESLLVLAGIEPPRKSAAPVRLTDVIRAALGEVEDYQRVAVRGVEPATILGSAAADLAHLLAELIENALVFSPPDQSVDIRGRQRPARAAEGAGNMSGYTLAIIDSGLGMPATDITAANRRLAGAESFTIAPSKYLGHYVAGNLAARHDIHVQLGSSPGNGITATIEIPPALLTTDTDLAAPVTPPRGNRVLGAGAGGAPALPAGARGGRPGPADGRLAPAWPASTHPAGDAGPAVRPLPVAGTMRTQSGLVKRAGRAGGSSTTGAGQPSGELLDSLRRHTTNLQGGAGPGAPPAPDHRGWAAPPAPDDPARPPAQWAWSSPPVTPSAPPPPAPTWTPTPAPTDWQAPPPAPTDWQAPGPAPTDWPAAPPAPTWTPTPAPTDWQSPPPAPTDWPASPAQPGAPAGDSTTSAGLTRRVRGAQLPNTQPVRMHRGPDPGAVPAQPGAAPRVRTPEQRRRADDVYSFLSSFTAGVQRGLDDAGGGRSDRGRQG